MFGWRWKSILQRLILNEYYLWTRFSINYFSPKYQLNKIFHNWTKYLNYFIIHKLFKQQQYMPNNGPLIVNKHTIFKHNFEIINYLKFRSNIWYFNNKSEWIIWIDRFLHNSYSLGRSSINFIDIYLINKWLQSRLDNYYLTKIANVWSIF